MPLREVFEKQPKSWVFAEAFVMLVALGYLDYLTTWDMSLFVFYGLPILLVVWYVSRRAAVVLAIIGGVVWLVANTATHPYNTMEAYVWAGVNRLGYFLFVAIGGAALRNQREQERARMEAMMRAWALEQEIVKVSEREQMRIGQDLHDGLCQNLAAIDCAAACLKSDLEARALPEAAAAGAIQKMLGQAVVEARNLARGISPVHMDADNLPAAIEELAAATNLSGQVAVMCVVRGDIRIGETQTAIHLYRIAQEALRNTIKHAQATRCTIELRQEGEQFTMTITDDGRGFAGTPLPSAGMGLGTIRYRARLINATCEITSRPGGGTVTRCSLAVPYASKS